MDINDLRTFITAFSFLIFIGIVFWAYSSRQKSRFEEAANLPFVEPDEPVSSNIETKKTGVRS
jgi:cytochrome c oxidase cbb3-type subunit 4